VVPPAAEWRRLYLTFRAPDLAEALEVELALRAAALAVVVAVFVVLRRLAERVPVLSRQLGVRPHAGALHAFARPCAAGHLLDADLRDVARAARRDAGVR